MRLTRPVAWLLILVVLATLGALAVRRSVARTQLSRLGVEPLLYTARPLGPTRQYGVWISGRHVDEAVFESVLDLLFASGYTHRAITLEAVSARKELRPLFCSFLLGESIWIGGAKCAKQLHVR